MFSASGSFFSKNEFLSLHTINFSFPLGRCVDEAVDNWANYQEQKYVYFPSVSHIDIS